jgi:hypothetical protein
MVVYSKAARLWYVFKLGSNQLCNLSSVVQVTVSPADLPEVKDIVQSQSLSVFLMHH